MFTTVPRFAHRCYHVWTTRTKQQKRNPHGALVCVRIEKCERCGLLNEATDLLIEAPKQEREEEAVLQSA